MSVAIRVIRAHSPASRDGHGDQDLRAPFSVRRALRARAARSRQGPQPLLPGPALQRHGLSRRQRARGDAPHQGRGRLGGHLHRAGRDPLLVGDHAVHRAAGVGRPGHPRARPHRRQHPRARRAGRHRADLQRDERAQLLQPRRAHGPRASARGDLHRRSGPGPADGPDGHRGPAALAPGRGAPVAAGGLRPRLRLRGPCARRRPPLPLPPLQRPDRRVRRLAGEPHAAAARAPRGHAGGGRRPRGGGVPHHRRRAARRRGHHARRHRGASSGRWASCPICGTSSWAPGRTTPSPRGSATRPSRSSTSAG